MKKKHKSIIFSLALLNIIFFFFFLDFSSSPELKVIYFDVGQGDSIFIETSSKHQILIDGGPSKSSLLEKLSYSMPFWDKSIDLIILTHVEKDHVTGLFDVLDNYVVENILWSGVEKETKINDTWEKLIKKEGANIYISDEVDKIILGETTLDIINFDRNKFLKDINDTSVLCKLYFKESTFLFTGDISIKVEKEIINDNISADILKIPHHGSKYSSSKDFIEKVNPLVAVIQVGKNSYGHPTNEVLTLLSNFGIRTLRNDINGDIKIVSDGTDYKIIISKK
jgi:competence protein ComEC